MRILLRADASQDQGTGHIMRCMTLAEGLVAQGHEVALMGALGQVPWLSDLIMRSGVRHIATDPDALDVDEINVLRFNWVVVDSYRIRAESISLLNESTPCLAIVDGDIRGITATLYLDQNLGASAEDYPEVDEAQILAGSRFALTRDAILKHRRPSGASAVINRPRVVAFMGGTDPDGAIVEVAASIAAQHLDITLDLVSPRRWIELTESAAAEVPNLRVIEPTADLPSILGSADIVISAAGTSAWDICAMVRPALLIALVDNQRSSLKEIAQAGVALTIDATSGEQGALSGTGMLLATLVGNQTLRRQLTVRCEEHFDGRGKLRVTQAMEKVSP